MNTALKLAIMPLLVIAEIAGASLPKCELLAGSDAPKLVQFLRDGQAGNPDPHCVEYALRRLGDERVSEATPVLASYLSFRRPETEREAMGMGGALGTIGNEFPAVLALVQIGQPALPTLLQVIETEGGDSAAHRDGIYAVIQIFHSGPAAIHFIKHSATTAKSPSARDRLAVAAKEAVDLCGVSERSSCQSAVTDRLR
ncbi:MAG TPA: hypothetical protein VIX19_13690 [Terriglobales bacterium]